MDGELTRSCVRKWFWSTKTKNGKGMTLNLGRSDDGEDLHFEKY